MIENTRPKTQTNPPQHTQSIFSPPQHTSPLQFQQVVLPPLPQNSIDKIADRTRYRVISREVAAVSRNRGSHSLPPRRTHNNGALERNRQASSVEARCGKESKAGGLGRSGGDPEGQPYSRTSSDSSGECSERDSSSERSREAAAEVNRSTSNNPPQRLSATTTVTAQPCFTRTITSTRYFTSHTKAYFVSNVQCNTPQMFEGLGPDIACVIEHFVPLVKFRSSTRYKNISKSSYTNNYNKNTKNSLYDDVMLHKYCYALVVHPNTSLYKEINYTLVAMHDTLEFKHKHTKLPFLKAMLHPAPQIKLWGGEGLKSTRVKHILKNIPLKKLFSKKIRMLILQLHNTVSQTNSKTDSHKCIRSCKNNRDNQKNSCKNFIQRLGPQIIYNRNKNLIQPASKYEQNLNSYMYSWSHTKN